jgi:2'-5' RNA ligase
VNRPGFNSYLKVVLDDTTMDILHKMAGDVQAKVLQENERPNDDFSPTQVQENEVASKQGEQNTTRQPSKARQSKMKKPLRFKPRSRGSLHMTLFFGAETICELPLTELTEWHVRVSERLAQSGFLLQDNNESSKQHTSEEDFSFQVVGLKVFPPQRNNLVVALLESAPAWQALHQDIHEIAKDESCSKALAESTRFGKETWVSHITLGNLYGGTKAQIKSLDHSLLQQVFESNLSSDDDSFIPVCTTGITMGGPVPEQIPLLDWDFRYASPVQVAWKDTAENH